MRLLVFRMRPLEEIVERIDHLEDEADVGVLASLTSGGRDRSGPLQ